MCGIAFSAAGRSEVEAMLDVMRHRGPDGRGVTVLSDGGFTGDGEGPSLGHVRLWVRGDPDAEQPIVGDGRAVAVNGEVYNYREIVGEDVPSDSWAVFESVRDVSTAKGALRVLMGEYSFVTVFEDGTVVAGRDPVGVRPLYYSMEGGVLRIASEKKALWRVGAREVRRLPPGSVLVAGDEGVDVTGVVRIPRPEPGSHGVEELEDALRDAVARRVEETERVGVVLSGGVDSTTVTVLASEYVDVQAYSAGFPGSEDVDFAERVAREIGVEFEAVDLSEDFPRFVVATVYAVESCNPMKVEVGIPVLACAEAMGRDGLKVMLSGQGADELLGGYHRYTRLYDDPVALMFELWRDVASIHEVNLERDDKAGMFGGSVELRVPFLDMDVVRVGMGIHPYDNLASADDKLRKRALRKVAERVGVPRFVVERRKVATQYGSMTSKELDRLARSVGVKKGVARELGYRSHKELFLRLVGKRLGFPWEAPDPEEVERVASKMGMEASLVEFLEEYVDPFAREVAGR